MAHPLVEVDAFDASVTVPDDGDTENAASVETGFQSLANRTKNLDARIADLLAKVSALEVFADVAISGSGIAEGAKFTLALTAQLGGFSIDGGQNLVLPAGSGAAYLLMLNFEFDHSATASNTILFHPQIVDKGITTSYVVSPTGLHQNTDHPTNNMIVSASAIVTGVNPALDLFKFALIVTNTGVSGTYDGSGNVVVRRII
jgi:hypothetical protein